MLRVHRKEIAMYPDSVNATVLECLDAWSSRPVSKWLSYASAMKMQGGPWLAAEHARRSALMQGVSALAVWTVLDLCETAWMLAPRDCSVSETAAAAARAAVQCAALSQLMGSSTSADIVS